MKPRPAVIFSVKLLSAPTDNSAPPSAHKAPAMSRAHRRIREGFTPAERAAKGYSPTAANRKPNRLRRKTTHAATANRGASHTNSDDSDRITPHPSFTPETGRGRTASV